MRSKRASVTLVTLSNNSSERREDVMLRDMRSTKMILRSPAGVAAPSGLMFSAWHHGDRYSNVNNSIPVQQIVEAMKGLLESRRKGSVKRITFLKAWGR